jgi:hypothetical protein
MSIKRFAIGFAVTLAMGFCLSLVHGGNDQKRSMIVKEDNKQVTEFKLQ